MIALFNYLLLLLAGCATNSAADGPPGENIPLEEAWAPLTAPEIAPPNTVEKVVRPFPDASQMSVPLLSTGTFHEGEVPEQASDMEWVGLFMGAGGRCYLSKTSVLSDRVHDPIIDASEDLKTGWEIRTGTQDSCLLLIDASATLREGTVAIHSFKENTLYPGDSAAFDFQGVHYKLEATGRKLTTESGIVSVEDYRLYLHATIMGKPVKTLLVAQEHFNETLTRILFGGDIDGDGRLDLLLDTSNHYNHTQPTLYLSKNASDGALVQPVGFWSATGC